MATETVIYVSLALVLLTRIYVFISPPEFLEEHKDRRYHEYHLYRQYHLHKQYDQNDLHTEQQLKQHHHHEEQDESFMSRKQEKMGEPKENSLNGLHHPSDELVLLGMGPGARPFPLRELSTQALSKLSPMTLSLTTTSATTHSTVREKNERHIWNHILGSSDDLSVPNYLSLDTTEIHYNGSLSKFEQDPEVHEAIRELKAGQRDMAKECPVMTAVWEGGRWCCLEGRTLYILRALNWQGQVRVRVLVDKNPTTLAVTEECWKAAGIASDMSSRITTTTTTMTTATTTVVASSNLVQSSSSTSLTGDMFTESATTHSVYFNKDAREPRTSRVRTSAASAVANSLAVGLSLADGPGDGAVAHEVVFHVNSGLLVGESTSRPGSPAGHEADDEEEEDEDPLEDVIDSEGYMEDDEGDVDEDEPPLGLERRTLSGNSTNSVHPLNLRRRRHQTSMSNSRAHRNFQPHVSPQTPPSPLLLPNKDLTHPSQLSSFTLAGPNSGRKTSFGSTEPLNKKEGDINHFKQQKQEQQHYQQQQHERKISIPEFLLPPPLHDEQVYLIVDPSRDVQPRRDSGHGDST
ncbi:hypothetical protein BGZ51_006219 [Haplosporangium sp. Z 767]|nr:hypothetical protein BGZ51_006219 [Haplosporangium sp. Z 767]